MIKSHHILFLKTLDCVLDVLNSPYLNYTVSKETVIELVKPKIVFDKVYENEKSKFLTENYDKYTESQTKIYLINSALDHLSENKYINTHKKGNGEIFYQITHKGFLKIHLGFVKSFENDKLKLDTLKSQQNIDNTLNIIKTLTPYLLAVLTFIIGKLS